MASYKTADIRNVVFCGHSDCGKTSLAEAMLFAAGAIGRKGSVTDQNTVADFEVEEKDRGHSIDLAVLHLDWKGKRLNLLDAPGRPDFVGQGIQALSAVETAAIVVNASAGLGVNSRRMWLEAEKAGLGRVIIVNKMDAENIDLPALLGKLREAFGERVIPANLPMGHGPAFKGVVPTLVLPADIPGGLRDEAEEVHKGIMEAVIEADDQLLERYLGGEEIDPAELSRGVAAAIRAGTVVPVLFTSAAKDLGVPELLDFLTTAVPSPVGAVRRPAKGKDGPVPVTSDSPLTAQVFKIMTDDYVGKISFLRVFSGELKAESTFLNVKTGKGEKVKEVFTMQGRDQKSVPSIIAGDIGAMTKIETLSVGDTVTADSFACELSRQVYPTPMVSLAVHPKSRNDEGKIGQALARLHEEDPTFLQVRRADTKQLVVSGLSALHLNIVLARLKRRFHVEVDTTTPRIPYRETISAKGDAKYRHKKQTGGAGQFAEVHMRVEPLPRGSDFEFVDEVVGGTIPRQFIPSCEKGVRSVLDIGAIAGYPVVDVRAVVYDGKHHPVDSKDIAFQTAARRAFKEAFAAARPVLLEPIMNIEILLPPEKMGDISGDLNSRRGRITGMDMAAGMQVIKATVPESEVLNYAADLQSMTGGEGTYTLEFSHYDVVPSHIASKIIAAAEKVKEEED